MDRWRPTKIDVNNWVIARLMPEIPGISENMIMQIRELFQLNVDMTGIASLVRLL